MRLQTFRTDSWHNSDSGHICCDICDICCETESVSFEVSILLYVCRTVSSPASAEPLAARSAQAAAQMRGQEGGAPENATREYAYFRYTPQT